MRAMEKDRTRRYQDANALALDVRRHLKSEPISAGPPSATYRVRKFVRRHRVGVGLIIIGVLGPIGGGFLTLGLLNRPSANKPTQADIDVLTANLVEEQIAFAWRVLADKEYKKAIEQAERILKLNPNNTEGRAIREKALAAIREIETSVAAARAAVGRGDAMEAAGALERVLARDPKNPVVSELSRQLNAVFLARATTAKSDMEKLRSQARGKVGVAEDPAFAEGDRLAVTAGRDLNDRQFTAATQGYLQARDAFDRALRVDRWKGAPVFQEGEVEEGPRLLVHEVPKPKLEPGRVVSVTVSWIVTPEGVVDDSKIVASASPEIDAFVLAGIQKWRYEPARKDGKIVPVRVLRKYTFGQH